MQRENIQEQLDSGKFVMPPKVDFEFGEMIDEHIRKIVREELVKLTNN
jgi:hypothetical protein